MPTSDTHRLGHNRSTALVFAYTTSNVVVAGFFTSFLIPAILMGVGVAVFLIGSPRYTKVPPEVGLHFTFIVMVTRDRRVHNEGGALLIV